MKKFIAFVNGNNSGIQTHDKAIVWAQTQMITGRVDSVHIAEVIEVVERTVPSIEIKRFSALEGELVSKAA